jgi:CRISPR-associated protein Csx17
MPDSSTLRLAGCSPTPLAHYLKALGVFRLVAEQADPNAAAWWESETFVIKSTLDYSALLQFLLGTYAPTPIVAPWNGGSGFFSASKETKSSPLRSITATTHRRLALYRDVISLAQSLISKLRLEGKPGDLDKTTLLKLCRNEFPDAVIPWIDAVYLLTNEGRKPPPLLGSGGNDGNLEFSNNFMRRLADVIDLPSGRPKDKSRMWLDAALFGTPTSSLLKDTAIGQFYPAAAGGANATAGFDADSLINPWDYILMIEGTLLFAASCVRSLGRPGPGVLAYPFTVYQVGVGYASASPQDELDKRKRMAEIWLPLWEQPCSLRELRVLFSEGKAQVGRRQAANGLDFSMALATLGVDRGISAFQRYGFQKRFGKNHLAIPLGRFLTNYRPEAELLAGIDSWLQTFIDKASRGKAPATISRALQMLERAIWDLCNLGGRSKTTAVLLALGECERALSKRSRWVADSYISPIPPLPPEWVAKTDDGSAEFRLAAALASITGKFRKKDQQVWLPLRGHLEPVRSGLRKDGTGYVQWDEDSANEVVWVEGNPVNSLNHIMHRRLVLAEQSGHACWSDLSRVKAGLAAVSAFIEGRVDFEKLASLLWGLALIDWPRFERSSWSPRPEPDLWPGAAYGLLKLCFAGQKIRNIEVPINPIIHHQANMGRGVAATAAAARRLKGSDLVPALDSAHLNGEHSRRTAASLLFPLGKKDLDFLASRVLRKK